MAQQGPPLFSPLYYTSEKAQPLFPLRHFLYLNEFFPKTKATSNLDKAAEAEVILY